MMKLHERLRRLRTGKHMTQAEVAERLHVTRQTVSSYESGRTEPDVEKLKCLAEIYGVTLEELLRFEAPDHRNTGRRAAGPAGNRGVDPDLYAGSFRFAVGRQPLLCGSGGTGDAGTEADFGDQIFYHGCGKRFGERASAVRTVAGDIASDPVFADRGSGEEPVERIGNSGGRYAIDPRSLESDG